MSFPFVLSATLAKAVPNSLLSCTVFVSASIVGSKVLESCIAGRNSSASCSADAVYLEINAVSVLQKDTLCGL